MGAPYTFLNHYVTVTPRGVSHDQLSGCLDFTGPWVAYDIDLGPDIEVSIFPTYATKSYTLTPLGIRMRIII